MPKMFEPSSEKLLAMIANAEAKCSSAIASHQEELAEQRMERFLLAQAKARQWRRSFER